MIALKLPGRKGFTPFPVGGKGAGIEIIAADAVIENGRDAARYTVRFLCCGTEKEMTQKQVADRVRFSYQKCSQCHKKKNEVQKANWKRIRQSHITSPFAKDALRAALSGKWK